jgi:hypothetical protein
MPAKTTQATAAKPPAPPTAKADLARPDRVSLGLLSLLVGSVALSLYSAPFLLTRILSVLLGIGGIGLAVFQFRTNEKTGRNFTSAIAGTLFSAAALLLPAIGPYLPGPSTRAARAPTVASVQKATDGKKQTAEPVSQPAQSVSETTSAIAEQPKEVSQIPINAPKVIPFPCRKSFQLVASPSPEWTDAVKSALLQGEVAVGVASVAVERLELSREGKPVSSTTDNLVIHLQVVLIGTEAKVDFESWGNSNFGDGRNRPILTGNSSHAYSLRKFEAGTQVAGHERSKGLYPKLYADDYLIFEAPRPGLEYFRLELPASAFGGMGTLRFQIPKSMVQPR